MSTKKTEITELNESELETVAGGARNPNVGIAVTAIPTTTTSSNPEDKQRGGAHTDPHDTSSSLTTGTATTTTGKI